MFAVQTKLSYRTNDPVWMLKCPAYCMELSITRVVAAAAAAAAKNVINLLVCIVQRKSHARSFFYRLQALFLTERRTQCFIVEWEDIKKVFVADKGVFPFFLPVKKYHDPIPAVAKVGGGSIRFHSSSLLLTAANISSLLSIEGRMEKMGGRAFLKSHFFDVWDTHGRTTMAYNHHQCRQAALSS